MASSAMGQGCLLCCLLLLLDSRVSSLPPSTTARTTQRSGWDLAGILGQAGTLLEEGVELGETVAGLPSRDMATNTTYTPTEGTQQTSTSSTTTQRTTTTYTYTSTTTTTTTTSTTTTPGITITRRPVTVNCEVGVCLQALGATTPNREVTEGNVMVKGRPVCDDNWGMEEATVVCKQLGWPRAITATRESTYGSVNGNSYAMDNVKCLGTEEDLQNCRFSPQDDCNGGEAAGAVCDTRRDLEAILEDTCYQIDITYQPEITTPANCSQVQWSPAPGDTCVDYNVTSFSACQTLCQNVTGCKFWTFYQDDSSNTTACYSKTGDTPRTLKVGTVSGPRNCSNYNRTEETTCFEEGVGFNYGDYLDYFTTTDAAACQVRCQTYSGCVSFSFYSSNSECYMKRAITDRRNNSEVVSGPKLCGDPLDNLPLPLQPPGSPLATSCSSLGQVCLLGGARASNNQSFLPYEGNVYVGTGNDC